MMMMMMMMIMIIIIILPDNGNMLTLHVQTMPERPRVRPLLRRGASLNLSNLPPPQQQRATIPEQPHDSSEEYNALHRHSCPDVLPSHMLPRDHDRRTGIGSAVEEASPVVSAEDGDEDPARASANAWLPEPCTPCDDRSISHNNTECVTATQAVTTCFDNSTVQPWAWRHVLTSTLLVAEGAFLILMPM